ncbi:PadR family transcriptional regulator [Tengunoibacter tsumagoiensis]|uniref:PadR family transcriptional regulator n=1 Tax=Tengunoibacter tsumagoiensis TaxID=2014871 RepID=A0A401ZUT7_9CHLR|nr:PadR family transcriptional regulator [Tengunoibacter tsumagoiensis]GCE10661.1 PadR family transcriptional regulator [Tengunoibacter tsumagoiensis]
MQSNEPAEYALLGLLKIQSMHGYEMFHYFEHGMLGKIVHLEMSQLYAYLKKLERMEYIQARLEAQGSRPPRKVFHLTTRGERLFQDWLRSSVEKPREMRMLFLIKLYFARLFIPNEVADLLQRQIEACQTFLIQLETRTLSNPGSLPLEHSSDEAFFEQVVLSSRIYQTRSLLTWLIELHREMAEIR